MSEQRSSADDEGVESSIPASTHHPSEPARPVAVNQGRTILKNSAFLIVADVLRRAFSLVTVLLVARSLGVEAFGQYTFVLSFVMLFGGFATFGLDTVLIKDVARLPERTESQFTATLMLKAGTSALTAVVIIGTISLLEYPPATVRAVQLMALASVFFALTDTTAALCTATQKMEYASLISVARGILLLALVPAFLWIGTGLTEVILAQLTSAALLFAFSLVVVSSRVAHLSPHLDRQLFGSVLRSALPFVLIGGISMVSGYRLDVLMLSRIAGDAARGAYGSAYTPIELVLSIAGLLTAALFPALSQAFGVSRAALRPLATRSLKTFMVLSLPMSLGIALLAPQILRLLFSEEFAVGEGALRVLGATMWISFLQTLMGWLVTAMDRLRFLVILNVFELVLNLGMNLLLIPAFGAAGAAGSHAITAFAALSLLFTVTYQADIVAVKDLKLPRILLATFGMGLVTWFARDLNLFLVVSGAAVLYCVLLWLTRAIDRAEMEQLTGMIRGALRRN